MNITESECDNDWPIHGGYCWFISNTAPLTELSWQRGRDYCLQQGGELASVHAQDDHDFILAIVRMTYIFLRICRSPHMTYTITVINTDNGQA